MAYTKAVYNATNKYITTQNEDMLKLNITNMFLNSLKYMCYISYVENFDYSNNYIARIIPTENKNENIVYQSITNLRHLPLVMNRDLNQIELANNHLKYSRLEDFLLHSTINIQIFNNLLKSKISEQYLNNLGNNLKITLLHGIKYVGGTTSGLGEGYLYCTPDYGHSRRRIKRHDFVDIDIGNNIVHLAKLLCLIEVSLNNKILHYAIVQYIRKIEQGNGKPFFTCVWDFVGNTYNHEIDVISINCIQRPAIVIPMFHLKINTIKPKHTDKFWYIPIKFFDRTGWTEDLANVINESGLSLGNSSPTEYLFQEASITMNTTRVSNINNLNNNDNSDDSENLESTSDDDNNNNDDF